MEKELLVGRKVISALINDEKDLVILDTDKGKVELTWDGDCCAVCYLANVSGVEALIGHTILEVENSEWKDISKDGPYDDVLESMGSKVKTTGGYVTFESRVDHNGYYGGSIEVKEVDSVPHNLNILKDF